ncbi:MAG: hypothetical protein ACK4RK_01305 [Gemmataceae bacterium]
MFFPFRALNLLLLGVPCLSILCLAPSRSLAQEDGVRQAFVNLQAGFLNQELGGGLQALWNMLDRDTQTEADQTAQTIRDLYAQASPAERMRLVKAFGLPGTDLAQLTGMRYLRTRRCQHLYGDFADATLANITVHQGTATVTYREPYQPPRMLMFVLQNGQWKARLPLPQVMIPEKE